VFLLDAASPVNHHSRFKRDISTWPTTTETVSPYRRAYLRIQCLDHGNVGTRQMTIAIAWFRAENQPRESVDITTMRYRVRRDNNCNSACKSMHCFSDKKFFLQSPRQISNAHLTETTRGSLKEPFHDPRQKHLTKSSLFVEIESITQEV
jgi:hypothetical protein